MVKFVLERKERGLGQFRSDQESWPVDLTDISPENWLKICLEVYWNGWGQPCLSTLRTQMDLRFIGIGIEAARVAERECVWPQPRLPPNFLPKQLPGLGCHIQRGASFHVGRATGDDWVFQVSKLAASKIAIHTEIADGFLGTVGYTEEERIQSSGFERIITLRDLSDEQFRALCKNIRIHHPLRFYVNMRLGYKFAKPRITGIPIAKAPRST